MCLFEPQVQFDHHSVLCKLRVCGPCESYQPFPLSTFWVVCRAPYDSWNINIACFNMIAVKDKLGVHTHNANVTPTHTH